MQTCKATIDFQIFPPDFKCFKSVSKFKIPANFNYVEKLAKRNVAIISILILKSNSENVPLLRILTISEKIANFFYLNAMALYKYAISSILIRRQLKDLNWLVSLKHRDISLDKKRRHLKH